MVWYFDKRNIMNQYQKEEVSVQSLLPMLMMPEHDEIPHIILSVSPCRSGTTAMLRVIGNMGPAAYFQPLKNLLRWQMQGKPFFWSLPADAAKTIYIKETLGPYSWAESTFNPLALLLQAGLPPHKLHLWVYGRYPLNSYASWLKWWQQKTNIDYFIATYHTIAQMYQQAVHANIQTTTLTYEILNRFPIPAIIAKLAQRFGLIYTDNTIQNWDTLPPFGSPDSNIFLPEEPAIFITPNIHNRIYNATRFTYIATEENALAAIPQADQQQIEASGIIAIYNQWHDNCLHDLQLLALDG